MSHCESEISAMQEALAEDPMFPSCIQQQATCTVAAVCLGPRRCPHSPMRFESETDEIPPYTDGLADTQLCVGELCLSGAAAIDM